MEESNGSSNGRSSRGRSVNGSTANGKKLKVSANVDIEVKPVTPNQENYLKAMMRSDITLVHGPAGTGKTYMAITQGLISVFRKRYKQLVISRPAVEAGERIGALPGDLNDKMFHYVRPSLDVICDLLPNCKPDELIRSKNMIEVVSVGYMRGRTFKNSFVVIDEAQSLDSKDMLMVLTRLGAGSKMIICGDTTQDDLDRGKQSGFIRAIRNLAKTDGVSVVQLDVSDVQRHQTVANVLKDFGLLDTER